MGPDPCPCPFVRVPRGRNPFLTLANMRSPMALQRAEAAPERTYESIDPAVAHASRDAATLRRILLDERLRMWERYRALFALRALGTPEAVEAIGRCMLTDDSALLRHECAFVFGQMALEQSIPWLERAVASDEHAMVRHEACEALGAIANDDCVAILRHYQVKDSAVEVRESCEVALDNIAYLRDPARF